MAAAVVTVSTNLVRGTAGAFIGTSIDATDGLFLKWDVPDERALIVLINADTSNAVTTLKLKKGDGLGAAAADVDIGLTAGQTKVLAIESAKFLITTGTNKGYIKFTDSSGDTKVALVRLP